MNHRQPIQTSASTSMKQTKQTHESLEKTNRHAAIKKEKIVLMKLLERETMNNEETWRDQVMYVLIKKNESNNQKS